MVTLRLPFFPPFPPFFLPLPAESGRFLDPLVCFLSALGSGRGAGGGVWGVGISPRSDIEEFRPYRSDSAPVECQHRIYTHASLLIHVVEWRESRYII